MTLAYLSGVLLVVGCGDAAAEVAMSATFTATQSCPAYQSIRKATNPGSITVEPNKAYDVLAKNKPNATHYRVIVADALPTERWVSASCGTLTASSQLTRKVAKMVPAAAAAAAGATAAATGAAAGNDGGARATHVLALGWEPAFCTKHADKKECGELTASSFGATHLSLHGLWPQPRGKQFCNVAPGDRQADREHNWDALPEPEMSAATLRRLAAVMPGAQSNLQRHEWIVHGSCFGGPADGYFSRAAGLAEAVDASPVATLFAGSVGQTLTAEQIRSAFDDAFGFGAGARVTVSCNGRGESRKITELVINLAGDVAGAASLGDLMRAAQPAPAGCPSGRVQPAPR